MTFATGKPATTMIVSTDALRQMVRSLTQKKSNLCSGDGKWIALLPPLHQADCAATEYRYVQGSAFVKDTSHAS
jgi:hypothetical protein